MALKNIDRVTKVPKLEVAGFFGRRDEVLVCGMNPDVTDLRSEPMQTRGGGGGWGRPGQRS